MIKRCIGTLLALVLVTASAVTGYATGSAAVQLDFYTDGVNVIVNGTPAISSAEITLEFASTVKNPTVKWASHPSNSYLSYKQDGDKLTLYIDSPDGNISQNGTTTAAQISYSQYKNTDSVVAVTLKTVDRDLNSVDYQTVPVTQRKYDHKLHNSSSGGSWDDEDDWNGGTTSSSSSSSSQPQEVPSTSSQATKPGQSAGSAGQVVPPERTEQPQEPAESNPAGVVVNTEKGTIYTLKDKDTAIPYDVMYVLYEQNTSQPVEIHGNGYVMRFAQGSMQMPYEGTAFDAGVRIDVSPSGEYPIGEEEHLVAAVKFAHHGLLPGRAEITLELGGAFANQELHYSYFDQQQNLLAETQTVNADPSGRITVEQEHCSTFLVTSSLEQVSTQSPATKRKSMTPIALVIIAAAVVALFAYFFKASSKKKGKENRSKQ